MFLMALSGKLTRRESLLRRALLSFFVLVLLLVIAFPAFAQTATPTPSPTPVPPVTYINVVESGAGMITTFTVVKVILFAIVVAFLIFVLVKGMRRYVF